MAGGAGSLPDGGAVCAECWDRDGAAMAAAAAGQMGKWLLAREWRGCYPRGRSLSWKRGNVLRRGSR